MIEPTSASSPGSEDSTSQSSLWDTDASDRSSGTNTASESWSDTGLMSCDGETLLPTPRAAAERPTHHKGRVMQTASQFYLSISSAAASPASQPQQQASARAAPTIAGYGPSSPVLLASYDPDTSSWRTFQGSLLSIQDERFPRYWETWPRSGMTRDGRAYALPISGHRTDASGYSWLPTPDTMPDAYVTTPRKAANFDTGHAVSLGQRIEYLHTPTTGDTSPTYDHRASPGYVRAIPVPNLAAQVMGRLLASPKANESNGPGIHGNGGPDLRTIVRMLPTPVADNSRGLAQTGTDYQSLPNTVLSLGEPTNQPSEDGSE